MTTTLFNPGVRAFTHWANNLEKRLFLVVDIPLHPGDTVVLMEVKDYGELEERTFVPLPYIDWIVLVEDKKQLIPYTPKL